MNYKIRKDTSLESISAANLMILNEVGRPAGAVIETYNYEGKQKAPLPVPKLNLTKALQINHKMYNNQAEMPALQQFQAPMESSNRGSYMGFKLH